MEVNCPSCFAVSDQDVTPFGAWHFAVFVLVALFYWGAAAPAFAHEGHDLVETAQAPSTPHGLPRLVTNSELYELVAVLL